MACRGEKNVSIEWIFSEISDFTTSEQLTATYSSTETGLSWLELHNYKEGYYQCQIGNGSSFYIFVFDQSSTSKFITFNLDSFEVFMLLFHFVSTIVLVPVRIATSCAVGNVGLVASLNVIL